MPQSHQPTLPIVLFLAGLCITQPSVATPACNLLSMEQQLKIEELHTDLPQYAEINYRKQLLRYVNGYYSNIAEDLLRGEGQYLNALHRLMGSDSASCTATYKELLVSQPSSQDFAMDLWSMRTASSTEANTAKISSNSQKKVIHQDM
jgi:hypothetical protein